MIRRFALASPALALVCAALWGLTVLANWPGHYSVDSVVQLVEGMTGYYVSYNPPLMGQLLAFVSRVGGHGAFMGLIAGLYFAALYLMVAGAGRAGASRKVLIAVLLVAAALNPVSFVYNGTVWKDVFCANLLLLALALADRSRKWASVETLLAVLLCSMAALVRQQGAIGALAVCLLAAYRQQVVWAGLRAFALSALRMLALTVACVALLQSVVRVGQVEVEQSPVPKGLVVAARFDIAGILRFTSKDPTPVLRNYKLDPEQLVGLARHSYSPERVDTLASVPDALARVGDPGILRLWQDLATFDPAALCRHKLAAASRLLGSRSDGACLPAHVGVAAEALTIVAGLGVPYRFGDDFLPEPSRHAGSLWRYVQQSLPAFNGYLWAAGLLLVLVAGLWRRNALAIALALAASAHVASFLVIGVACDFRYIYFAVASVWAGVLALLACGVGLPPSRPERQHSTGAGIETH
ncbi:hypothetical protein GCM10025771_25800 [Niveibacterium umoris]|uniref:Glycosyltransferase RgtA/B/C/D-like domain-containing protein n=1 Tax=Niveibacterium umoris TaxID=1193620 RepID=A0A840BKT5_9RHOO|nr:hypothetical protein [Niveibacterium umoris]MBB4012232.1 hypothetical protein [Niveibacterium umoris]